MSQEMTHPPRRSVRSFDIFDTLIARSVADPTDVFDIVERSGAVGFKELRLRAQALSNHTWSNIYEQYQRLSGCNDAEIARLQQLEIDAEISVTYLISDVNHQICDGDILVSDMYLTPEILNTILVSAGFSKKVDIFVSSCGKAIGSAWPDLQNYYEIQHHLGDNLVSDVHSPARHGIPSSHYARSMATPMELLLEDGGAVATAALLRRFRLTNPFAPDTRENQLHDVQASVNLPFLLLMAVRLQDILQSEQLSRILFTTRDSCLLQPIFELLFPDTDSRTFYSSRVAFQEQRPAFVDYVKRLYAPGKTLIFDLHGAFGSGRSLFSEVFGELPRVHIFSGAQDRAPSYSGLSYDLLPGSNRVEALNLDQVGSLVAIDGEGFPVRAPAPAACVEVGGIYRAICARFIEDLRPKLEMVRAELFALDRDIPWARIDRFICDAVETMPEISAVFEEHRSLTQIMNEARSDKGSTHACAHCYSYVYERLVQELAPRERLSLLEIGLNRDGEEDIPSLRGWQAYLGAKATLYGADISPRFLAHHDPAAGIHILVADQCNRSDLVRCGLANPMGYDIIIDDGSHVSSHQQTTLSVLWQFLRPGGFYVIEDLHFQPYQEPVMGTRELLQSWQNNIPVSTPYLGAADVAKILREASAIEFHDSQSRLWGNAVHDALAIIRKQPG